jgi:hypothetical protein
MTCPPHDIAKQNCSFGIKQQLLTILVVDLNLTTIQSCFFLLCLLKYMKKKS